jgi:hypothetical protein
MGYYPLPASDAEVLRGLLHFPEHSSAIDP